MIQYQIKRSQRAKKVSLRLTSSGLLIAVLPAKYKTDILIKRFIEEKKDWIIKNTKHLKKHRYTTIDKNLLYKNFIKNKKSITQDIINKVNHYSNLYNVFYKKITIKNQSTIWGSCSKGKNLNFNFRIGYLPNNLQNYIIAHEICHLLEMNHSPRFWHLVNKSIPNYKSCIKKIRQFEKTLFI